MELGRLELPTSWVRFRRKRSPSVATSRHRAQRRGSAPSRLTASFHRLSRPLDQNLTKGPRTAVAAVASGAFLGEGEDSREWGVRDDDEVDERSRLRRGAVELIEEDDAGRAWTFLDRQERLLTAGGGAQKTALSAALAALVAGLGAVGVDVLDRLREQTVESLPLRACQGCEDLVVDLAQGAVELCEHLLTLG